MICGTLEGTLFIKLCCCCCLVIIKDVLFCFLLPRYLCYALVFFSLLSPSSSLPLFCGLSPPSLGLSSSSLSFRSVTSLLARWYSTSLSRHSHATATTTTLYFLKKFWIRDSTLCKVLTILN